MDPPGSWLMRNVVGLNRTVRREGEERTREGPGRGPRAPLRPGEPPRGRETSDSWVPTGDRVHPGPAQVTGHRRDRSAGTGSPAWVTLDGPRVVNAHRRNSVPSRPVSVWTPHDASDSRLSSNSHPLLDAWGTPRSDSQPRDETNSRARVTTQSALQHAHSRSPRTRVSDAAGASALITSGVTHYWHLHVARVAVSSQQTWSP